MTRVNIDTSALLVEVAVSTWTARVLDKRVTDEVVRDKGAAQKSAARVNKSLLAGRPELEEINKHVTDARQYVYAHTLPWSDSGLRLLPTAEFMKFNERLQMFAEEFEDKVKAFVAIYPSLITAQAMALGDMFNRDDYPSADSLQHKFAFRINYLPVPSAGDFRIDVGNEAQDELRAQLEKLAQERVANAMQDIKDRLREHLLRMSDRLTTDIVDDKAKGRRFTSSLIDGARDLCELAKSLNVVKDVALEQARRDLEAAIGDHNADDLRENDTARAAVKAKVDTILGKMSW